MWEAVERGPHRSATTPEAIKHFAKEIKEKLHTNQARLVPWDNIKDNPPCWGLYSYGMSMDRPYLS